MELLTVLAGISSCVTGIGDRCADPAAATGAGSCRRGRSTCGRGRNACCGAICIHTYYRNKERSAIRQYEYENFLLEYRAYKALRGNSFIDRIYQEVKTWDIVS